MEWHFTLKKKISILIYTFIQKQHGVQVMLCFGLTEPKIRLSIRSFCFSRKMLYFCHTEEWESFLGKILIKSQ